MSCTELTSCIDEYLDQGLSEAQRTHFEAHLAGCADCSERLIEARQLREALSALSYPPMTPGFIDQALRNARQAHEAKQTEGRRAQWYGLGGALAAGIAVMAIVVSLTGEVPLLGRTGEVLLGRAPVQHVEMQVHATHQLDLAFRTPEAITDATLELRLPSGLELAGRGAIRELKWQTELSAGVNLLPLTLVAKEAGRKVLLVYLQQGSQHKEFKMEINVLKEKSGRLQSTQPSPSRA